MRKVDESGDPLIDWHQAFSAFHVTPTVFEWNAKRMAPQRMEISGSMFELRWLGLFAVLTSGATDNPDAAVALFEDVSLRGSPTHVVRRRPAAVVLRDLIAVLADQPRPALG